MNLSYSKLGRGGNAASITQAIALGKKFPLMVYLTNLSKKQLVLAQAVPSVVLHAGERHPHICQTCDHLHDVIFGMIAIGDRLSQDIIGSISTKLPKGASK